MDNHSAPRYVDNSPIIVDKSPNMCTSVSFIWLELFKKSSIHSDLRVMHTKPRDIDMGL